MDPPTALGEVSGPLWTKYELLTLPRSGGRPETIILEPIFEPRKRVYPFVDRKIANVAVRNSSQAFHTLEICQLDTYPASQKCKKSKIESLGCLRVHTPRKTAHPPKKN